MIEAPPLIKEIVRSRIADGLFDMPARSKYAWLAILTRECGMSPDEARTFLYDSGTRMTRDSLKWPGLLALQRVYGLSRRARA